MTERPPAPRPYLIPSDDAEQGPIELLAIDICNSLTFVLWAVICVALIVGIPCATILLMKEAFP